MTSDDFDYINESYFAIIGLTGHGKSTFLNALSGFESCKVSSKGKSETQKNQLVSFVYKNHRFNAIDTPGLDDSTNNEEKINEIKEILKVQPKIKKLILIKKYDDVRLSGSMQNAIVSFMDAFPKKNFWDHVIIVNSRANKHNEDFKDYLENDYEEFINKIKECENLYDIMIKKGINPPIKLKEYFVDSKKVSKYPDIQEDFNTIKDDIRESKLMFKEVIVSDILERSRESQKNKGFYIITKYQEITCVDFDNTQTKLEKIIEETEKVPKNCHLNRTEEESEFDGKDSIKWYDVVSLGIARAIRNTKKYKVYKVNYYQVGDKEIKGDRVFDRVEFR